MNILFEFKTKTKSTTSKQKHDIVVLLYGFKFCYNLTIKYPLWLKCLSQSLYEICENYRCYCEYHTIVND